MTQELDMSPVIDRIPDIWGKSIDTGEAWYPIVLDINEKISELAPDYVIHQVKVKFGGLRYYIDSSTVPEEHRATVNRIIADGEVAVMELTRQS